MDSLVEVLLKVLKEQPVFPSELNRYPFSLKFHDIIAHQFFYLEMSISFAYDTFFALVNEIYSKSWVDTFV